MAYERASDNKIIGDSLDSFVQNLSNTYKVQVSARNAEDETKFNNSVLVDNINLQAQLDYRTAQLDRVKDDPTEKSRIKGEIQNLKDRIQQKTFSDAYLQKLTDYQGGLSSVDTLIGWLNNQNSSATDQNVKDAIAKELLTAQTQKFDLAKQLIETNTEYAIKDKTIPILDNQITKVQTARTAALLSGNNTLVGMYDLQLQSLTKAKTETTVSNDLKDIAVHLATGNGTATNMLDALNAKMSSSAPTGPITVGDTTYNSAQEYWQYKRDSFLADNSSNGFFGMLSDENKTKLNVEYSKNNLTTGLLQDTAHNLDTILARPELQPYVNQLAATKQDVLNTGGNLISNTITNKYSTDYDVNKAVNELTALKGLGINVEKTLADVLGNAASIKQGQVNNLANAVTGLMQNDPNLTPETALAQAIKSGYGTVFSPNELATTSEADLTKKITTTGAPGQNTGTMDPRLTVAPKTTPQNNNVPATPPSTPTIPSPINTQLDFGSTGPQVKSLQQFLNKAGFTVAAPGQAGSAGSETDYFGPATQAALKKFQVAHGIVSSGDAATTGFGRLGPQTLQAIQNFKS